MAKQLTDAQVEHIDSVKRLVAGDLLVVIDPRSRYYGQVGIVFAAANQMEGQLVGSHFPDEDGEVALDGVYHKLLQVMGVSGV